MNFDPETREVEDQVTADDWAPYAPPYSDRAAQQAEDDLRIRMFALDMAVTALPSLTSVSDSEDTKIRITRRAAAEFEKILRGE